MNADYPGDDTFKDIGEMITRDYREADIEIDGAVGQWAGRIIWDIVYRRVNPTDAIVKHRKVWRAMLGLPPLGQQVPRAIV